MYEFKLFSPADAGNIVDWNEGKAGDFLMQWAGRAFQHPITEAQVIEDARNCCNAVFSIFYQEEMIGTIALIQVDEKTGSAYWGHYLLNPAMTGKGHGTAILREFISYCFGILKLKELTLRVFAYNTSALQCYLTNGFVETERNTLDNGQDVLVMNLKKTKEESIDQSPVIIRLEEEKDRYAAEKMTQHAFWNLH